MAERQRKPVRRGLSRRQLLASAGATAGGLAFAAAASGEDPAVSPQDATGDVIGGVITAIGMSSLEIDRAGQPGVLSVDLRPDAELVRDGPVALSDFVVGDEVAVRGEFTATGSFTASSLHAFYRVVDAEVADRQGTTLQTSAGDLQLGPDSQAQGGTGAGQDLTAEPLGALGEGDHVVALGRNAPQGDEFIVARVGVVSD
jgi:hypothetical protein